MFSWDPAWARRNLAKHGVGFEIARLVFDDPLLVSRMDRMEKNEERWQTFGLVGQTLLLVVVHTLRWVPEPDGEEEIRIISARPATKAERKIYETGP